MLFSKGSSMILSNKDYEKGFEIEAKIYSYSSRIDIRKIEKNLGKQ